MKFTLAIAQMDSVLGDVSRNVERHLAFCERAVAGGAQLIVFPELSLTGYSVKDLNWELALDLRRENRLLNPLLEQSRSISILAGGIEEVGAGALYNAAFLFEGGRISSAHRKIYLPTYGMFEEMRYFSPGTTLEAVQTKQGKIGVLICEDAWHMSLPYLLAVDGAQVIVAMVASPTRVDGNDPVLHTAEVYRDHNRTYARLLSCYVAFCNRVGFEDGVNFWGGSTVTGPDGEQLAAAKLFDEELLLTHIDEVEIRRARKFSRHFLDERPEIVVRKLSSSW